MKREQLSWLAQMGKWSFGVVFVMGGSVVSGFVGGGGGRIYTTKSFELQYILKGLIKTVW